MGELDRRQETEQQDREHGGPQGEGEDGPVHLDVVDARELARQEAPQQIGAEEGRRDGFGETTRPYLVAGPTVGFVLTSHMAGSDTGVPFEADLMPVTQRLDVGVGVGGGLSRDVGRVATFVEARYVWGLTNLVKAGEAELTSPGTSFTMNVTFDEEANEYTYRGLHLLLGFTVPLGSGGRPS
jgi:hypothetical protein